jgi:hypothetical protein
MLCCTTSCYNSVSRASEVTLVDSMLSSSSEEHASRHAVISSAALARDTELPCSDCAAVSCSARRCCSLSELVYYVHHSALLLFTDDARVTAA